MHIFGILGVFFRYFLGVPEFRPEGYFCRYFSWKFRLGPSGGSVAGRDVLNNGEQKTLKNTKEIHSKRTTNRSAGRRQQNTTAGSLQHLAFQGKFAESLHSLNYYGDRELLRRKMFSTAGSFCVAVKVSPKIA